MTLKERLMEFSVADTAELSEEQFNSQWLVKKRRTSLARKEFGKKVEADEIEDRMLQEDESVKVLPIEYESIERKKIWKDMHGDSM